MTGTLRQAAEGYLQTRRSLGYRLEGQARLLMSYIADLEAAGESTVTAANAVAWATRPAGASAVWHARRLSAARCFARYLAVTDPSCQVPPSWLLPARYSRVAPYIYTQEEIDALAHAAGTLGSPLAAASCQAVICLLASTGMRIGEAVALTCADADLDNGIITIINGKHGASQARPAARDPHPDAAALRVAPGPALPGPAVRPVLPDPGRDAAVPRPAGRRVRPPARPRGDHRSRRPAASAHA